MSHLAEYVACIYSLNTIDPISIIHVETNVEKNLDQEQEQIIQTKIYTFSDGTLLKQTLENDNQFSTVEACLESWIEYQIIQQSNPSIQPQKIYFDNTCREMHWIKYFNHAEN